MHEKRTLYVPWPRGCENAAVNKLGCGVPRNSSTHYALPGVSCNRPLSVAAKHAPVPSRVAPPRAAKLAGAGTHGN